MAKRYDEEVRVERDAGMPSVFTWRGRRYEVADVIGRWRIEGRMRKATTSATASASATGG